MSMQVGMPTSPWASVRPGEPPSSPSTRAPYPLPSSVFSRLVSCPRRRSRSASEIACPFPQMADRDRGDRISIARRVVRNYRIPLTHAENFLALPGRGKTTVAAHRKFYFQASRRLDSSPHADNYRILKQCRTPVECRVGASCRGRILSGYIMFLRADRIEDVTFRHSSCWPDHAGTSAAFGCFQRGAR